LYRLKSYSKNCEKHEDDAHGCFSQVKILVGRQFQSPN
jgi:hypothetical protein